MQQWEINKFKEDSRVDKMESQGNIKGLIEVIDPTRRLFKRKWRFARPIAVMALGNIGDVKAVEPLIAALRDSDEIVRCYAAEALGKIGDTRAVEPLVSALRDKSNRVTVIIALGELGDRRAVEPLIALLVDKDDQLLLILVTALDKIRDVRAIEPLKALLRNHQKDIGKAAAAALSNLGWSPTMDEDGAFFWISRYDFERCAEVGAVAIKPLLAALGFKDPQIRREAALLLGKIGDASVVEPLLNTALQDRDDDVRRMAIIALRSIGDTSAIESLIVLLKDPDWGIKNEVITTLGRIAGTRAIEALIGVVKNDDEKDNTRLNAATALVEIYQSSALSSDQKHMILSNRSDIVGIHVDMRHEGFSNSDCSSNHTDNHISFDFPE